MFGYGKRRGRIADVRVCVVRFWDVREKRARVSKREAVARNVEREIRGCCRGV